MRFLFYKHMMKKKHSESVNLPHAYLRSVKQRQAEIA